MGLKLWGVYDVNGRIKAVCPHEPVMEDLEVQDAVRHLVASVVDEHEAEEVDRLRRSLDNFTELAATWACTVQQENTPPGRRFVVVDCDGEVLCEGRTPEEAAAEAIRFIANRG